MYCGVLTPPGQDHRSKRESRKVGTSFTPRARAELSSSLTLLELVRNVFRIVEFQEKRAICWRHIKQTIERVLFKTHP